MAGGRGWQFRFEPNVVKQIEQCAATVDPDEARDRVFAETQSFFAGPLFSLASWPDTPRDVLEHKDLQLALCATAALAADVCAYADKSDPAAPVPRRFRNAIVAIAPHPDAFNNALERAKRLIAAEQIEKDARHGDSAALVRDQLNRIKPGLAREFKIQTCRAFDTVVRADGVVGRIEEKYKVPDDEILSKPQGQKCLHKFLEDKGMIYRAGESLDPNLFLKKVLAGTTPIPDQPEVFRLSDVHERFLAAPGLRIAPHVSVIEQTILNSVDLGKTVVKTADGTAYDKAGGVEGPEGQRRAVPGAEAKIKLSEDELITRADSAAAKAWLKVDVKPGGYGPDEGKERQGPPPPPEPDIVIATNWPDIVKHAETRPLLKLILDAGTPAVADTLAAIAQPLGADQLALEVDVQGELKSGGNAAFNVQGIKLNSPIKPLKNAQTLFNAMTEGTMRYDAQLTLNFNEPGRAGLKPQLEAAAEKAGNHITLTATFGKLAAKARTK